MRLAVKHLTEYRYDVPVSYALQRLRLIPQSNPAQEIVSWEVDIEGADREVSYCDHFGNETWLLSVHGAPHMISIRAQGVVETKDTAGICKAPDSLVPLWFYLRNTQLTAPDRAINSFAAQFRDADDTVSALHAMMNAMGEQMTFDDDATASVTKAADAWQLKRGVCQDYTHVFCAAARSIGIPARYVSGYLMLNDRVEQVASHAWAEAHVDGLGWVGFDTANGIAPDERYVRVAAGMDYRDAAPVSGIRHGVSEESLAVHIQVEQ